MKKSRLQELAGLNESKVTIDDKDGQILYVALTLGYNRIVKSMALSSEEKGRLDKLMKDFEAAYGGDGDSTSSTGVDATANQLDRR
jgi:hypothetical protein